MLSVWCCTFISSTYIWVLRPLLGKLLHLVFRLSFFLVEIIVFLMWFLIEASPSWIEMCSPFISILVSLPNIWELRPLLCKLLHLMLLSRCSFIEIIVFLMWFLVETSPSRIEMSCPFICILISYSNIWELWPLLSKLLHLMFLLGCSFVEIIVFLMWFLVKASPSRVEMSCPFISILISLPNIWKLRPLFITQLNSTCRCYQRTIFHF